MPRYPFRFIQGDALEFFAAYGEQFDAIHASPPCQFHLTLSNRWRGKSKLVDGHVNWLTPTLRWLRSQERPWVVENVTGARAYMGHTIQLHGGMFGLSVHRPRLFESNVLLLAPQSPRAAKVIGVYGDRPDGRAINSRTKPENRVTFAAKSVEEAREAMGMDWANWRELTQAVPPAYTEFIGRQLLSAIRERVA